MKKNSLPKKLLALRISEVRSYFDKILNADADKVKAFHSDDVKLEQKNFRTQGNVAIIPIKGVITQFSDFFTWLFGGISCEEIEAQFDLALKDDSIKGIVLDIGSPGGEAGGVHDLASKIFNARSQKTIVSYVRDEAASAGYWLAAASSKIIASEIAITGSIGVIASFQNEDSKDVHFVSSISPNKRPDINLPEGKAQIQTWVNDVGSIFVNQIAKFRAVSSDDVINNFGKGDVLISKKAQVAGMIDQIGNFKTALMIASGQADEKIESQSESEKALQAINKSPVIMETLNKLSKEKDKDVFKTIVEREQIIFNKKELKNSITNNNKKSRSNVMNKIFAKILKGGLRAELHIVDDENEEAVIPDDSLPISEIDVEWLEQNLPELFEEIKQLGRDEENGRQEDGDDMDVDSDDEETQALFKTFRRDTKFRPEDLAMKLVKSFKGNPKSIKGKTNLENQGDLHVPTTAGNEQTDDDKELSLLKKGAKAFRDSKKIKAGIK